MTSLTARRPGRRFLRLALALIVLALTTVNAGWIWNDRPVVEMKTVDLWLAAGRVDDARMALREQIRRSPWYGDAMMKLARLLAKGSDYLGCARVLHDVPDWWPTKAEARYIEAISFKQVNRIREAEAAWKGCIAVDPLHPSPPGNYQGAARELIGTYILEGRIDEAREILMNAFDHATPEERADVMMMRMRAEIERIAHEEAVSKLRAFVDADPENWTSRRALALEEQLLGHADAADAEIAACLAARPDDPFVQRVRMEILHQRGDRAALKQALATLPPSADTEPEIWKFRGLVAEWDSNLEAAASHYLKASELNPREAEYLYKLGIIEQRLGRTGPAADHLRRSRAIRNTDAELNTTFRHFVDLAQTSKPGSPEYEAEVEHLASLCEQAGWRREAAAWRKLITTG